MSETKDLYVEYDEYRKKIINAKGDVKHCVDAFILEKIKALKIEKFTDKAYTLIAQALCDTISAATKNLKEIVAADLAAESVAFEQRKKVLSELRDAVGGEEDIPEEQRRSMFKRLCAWLLGRSWRETTMLAKDVLEKGGTCENINEDFASSTLDDVSMPERAEDTIEKTSGFLDQASRYNLFMAQGAISNQIVETLGGGVGEELSEVPEIVQAAFTTKILSQEEEELKKLVALEWLLAVVHEKGRDAVMSPLVVVKIARDAFVKVNDLKATIKRLEEQMAHSGEEVKQ